MIAETGLSLLRLRRPAAGRLARHADRATARTSATTYPWLFVFAAGLLVVTVLAVNLVGDGLRDALDPTSGVLIA